MRSEIAEEAEFAGPEGGPQAVEELPTTRRSPAFRRSSAPPLSFFPDVRRIGRKNLRPARGKRLRALLQSYGVAAMTPSVKVRPNKSDEKMVRLDQGVLARKCRSRSRYAIGRNACGVNRSKPTFCKGRWKSMTSKAPPRLKVCAPVPLREAGGPNRATTL